MALQLHRLWPAPGSGRLRVISACFLYGGVLGAVATAGIAFELAVGSLGWKTWPANPLVGLASCGLFTFGFLRTHRLLSRRKKAGGHMAALCLAGSIAGSFQAGHSGWSAAIIPAIGLALLASVWRHLD